MDLSGPHVEGRGFGMAHPGLGYRYFLCAVYQPPGVFGEEAKPAWPYVRWLKGKSQLEVLRAVQEVVAEIDAMHLQKSVYRLHSDRGGEFLNDSMRSWAAEKGLVLTHAEGHGPAGNGQAESYVGKLKARGRAMLSMVKLGT